MSSGARVVTEAARNATEVPAKSVTARIGPRSRRRHTGCAALSGAGNAGAEPKRVADLAARNVAVQNSAFSYGPI